MKTRSPSIALSASFGVLGVGPNRKPLVCSCDLFIPFPLAIDHRLASSSTMALKVGLLLCFLGALVRLDPASRQLAIFPKSLPWP